MRTLDGRTAMVVGASGGIGSAVALALAAEGAAVAVVARDAAALETVAVRCREHGVAAAVVAADVTAEQGCVEAVDAVRDQLGAPTVLVNAAGSGDARRFADVGTDRWRSLMAVHVEAPMVLMRTVLPDMVATGRGSVINIGSAASTVGLPYAAAYTAAKHAVLGLSRSVAAEYAGRGVTVNCVCPYYVDSPMTRAAIEERMRAKGFDHAEAIAPMVSPHGRLVTVDEVAALCVLLAGPNGESINGQAIHLDGGRVQR